MAGTVVFYSGVENKAHYDIAKTYAKRVLTSYFYARKNSDIVRRRFEQDGLAWMIDSGAHTLQKDKGNVLTAVQWEDYVKGYAEWLHDNRQYIFAGVELDVGTQTGLPIIYSWREKYLHPLEEEGMQIIYVWHAEQTPEEWASMCRKYRYVGLTHSSLESGILHQKMLTARKYRTKVHGFALTGGETLRDCGLYTADSTSWKSGERYGVWMVFDGDHMRSIEKEDREKWRSHITQAGFNFQKMLNEDRDEVSSFCIQEFRKMEETFNARKTDAGYWAIRTPYPEIVRRLHPKEVTGWLTYLKATSSAGTLDTLLIISQVQNSRLSEYMEQAERNDAVLSEILDIVVKIDDPLSLERIRDMFNSRFQLCKTAQKRKEEDYADNIVVQAREENFEEELLEATDIE